MIHGHLHQQLVERFEQLNQALLQLATQLRDSRLPLWLPLTDTEQQRQLDPRQKAIELYCDLWHQGDGDGRRTRSCHGLIGADQPLLNLAHKANLQKQQFQSLIKTLQTDSSEFVEHIQQRPSPLKELLGHRGLARLHLKQCYRQIPLVERHPLRVGLNWYTSGRSIKRLSWQQAEQRLVRMGTDKPHIQLQLDKLSALKRDTPLAQIQPQAPLMRANLKYETAPFRQAMNLSLPLLFGYDAEQPFPEHNSPSITPQLQRQRQIRSDCKIDPDPFLPSLRVHLYR